MKRLKGIVSDAYFSVMDPNFESGIARMKRHGFSGIDFHGFVEKGSDLLSLDAISLEKRLVAIRLATERNDVLIPQGHGPLQWPPKELEESDRKIQFDRMSKALYGEAVLGSSVMVFHPLAPYGERDISIGKQEETQKINVEFFSKVVEVGEKYHITICLENLPFPGLSVAHPLKVQEIVKKINSDFCKICLDTGHCIILDDPAKMAKDIGGDWIRAVHLHDNYGTQDQHKFPMDGIVNWKAFCTSLNEIGFAGMMDFETWARGHYPPEIKEYLEQGFSMLTDYIMNLA